MKLRREKSKYVEISQIGTVLFRASTKAKSVIISIKSNNQVVVSVPKFISYKKAEYFVLTRVDWIKKHRIKIRNKINTLHDVDEITNLQKNDLLERIRYLSEKHNLNYNKVTLKKMKTRWGSCSQNNIISLNVGLIALPSQLCDYVILHELMHTKIKDHSGHYWDELNSIIPQARYLNKQLNKNFKL